MNTIARSIKILKCPTKTAPAPLITLVRNHWNKDFKPTPYPKTEQERKASAEKYGVPLAEYEPYPDDGDGHGDYPKFRLVSAEARDEYYPWDFPEVKRNFNEVIHEDFDAVREDRYNADRQLPYPKSVLLGQYIGVVGTCALLFIIFEQFKCFLPITPPQYPSEGKTHYTFEQD